MLLRIIEKIELNRKRLGAGWIIVLFPSFCTVVIVARFALRGRQSAFLLEIVTDFLFMVAFTIALIYLYKQLREHFTYREKAYGKLFMKNPHPMWAYDLKTLRFLIVNDAAMSLYGYTEAEFLNMTIKDIRPDDDVPALIDAAERIKLNFNLNYHWSGTWRHKKKNNELMYVEISSHEIIFEGKKAELVLAYNITERINQDLKLQFLKRDLERNVIKRTDDLLLLNRKLVDQNKLIKSANLELYSISNQLQEANENIQQQTDAKNKFISMASHEFRTPLTSIQLAASFMKRYFDQTSREDSLRKIESIERQVSNMTFLLDDMLTIGNVDAPQLQVKSEPVDICDFVTRITQEVQSATSSGTHRILLSIGEAVPKIVQSDEKLLRNIFINLLTNAIKYSPERNVVYFDIGFLDGEITFCVKDEGLGICAVELSHIFEAFYRVDTHRSIPGTGLGLSIVKKAADLINAQVRVESEVGHGSTFHVMLPVSS